MVKKIQWTEEELEDINKIVEDALEESMQERARERVKGAYNGPKYDEEYLKQFEHLPRGKKFTEKELDEITDRAYPGIKRSEHLWNYDHSEVQGFDKKCRDPLNTEENIKARARKYWGEYTPDNYAYIDFYDLAMGNITPREFHRRIFKEMVCRRYEK